MYRLELLQMMGENVRFGPGVTVSVVGVRSYVEQVLDAVGHEVERDLTWQWPAAYNGPQRRAAVRMRLEALLRLRWRAAVRSPLAQMKISGITT